MNPQAMLNYLLGITEGSVLYSIYSIYANKITGKETGQGFDVDKDEHLPYKNIVNFTGLLPDTIRGVIERLVKRGLLQKKPGNNYELVLESSVFIELAKERLKTPPKNALNRKSDERFLPQIISTLEKDQYVLVALGLVNRTRLEEFLGESNPAKKVTDTEEIQETTSQESKSSQETKSSHEFNSPETKEELIIRKYVSVLQRKWSEECE